MALSRRIPVIFVLMLLCISLASAVSISATPSSISPGGTITITINDLVDTSTFSLLVESAFDVTPGDRFEFETTNFNMPISLSDGTVSAYTQNTESTKMTVIKDETEYSIAGPSTDGIYSDSQNRDISSGTYSEISLGGRALADESSIVARFNLVGTKTGPEDSTISFNAGGIQAGTLRVKALVNNQVYMDKIITIGTPVAATLPSTIVSTPTATPTVTATVTGTVTPTPTQGPSVTIIESMDGKVRFSAVNAEDAILTLGSVTNIPSGWDKVSDAYTIIMDGLSSASNGKITFIMPVDVVENIDDYNLFVAQYKNGEWTALPSTYQFGTIFATVTEEGTYCAMNGKELSSAYTSSQFPYQQKETTGLPAYILLISVGLAVVFLFFRRKN